MIDFALPPEVGTILLVDEQTYELREARPASRNDGTPTMLLDWETVCPSCGRPFVLTTGLRSSSVNRRCGNCKNPAKPVKGKRGRKVRVEVIKA